MAEFPDNIFVARDTQNLPGIVYDPSDKKNFFSEDFQNLGAEITAIETILGENPNGAYSTVKAWLQALADAVGLTLNLITITSDYLVTNDNDVIWIDATSGNIIITLPPIASALIKKFVFSRRDNSINTVTIQADGSETINGNNTLLIGSQYSYLSLITDQVTEWAI